MNVKDIEFQTVSRELEYFIKDSYADFENHYDGFLHYSQISRVIETILLGLPLPIIWADHFGKDFFANGHIISAYKEFKISGMSILNITGLCSFAQGLNYDTLDGYLQRRLDETIVSVKLLTSVNTMHTKQIKELVWNSLSEKVFCVKY